MADTEQRRNWAGSLTALAALLAFGSVLTALVLAIGSGQGWWDFRTGLTPFRYIFYTAAAGGVVALIALFGARRSRKLILTNLLAIVVAGGFCLYLGSLARTAGAVPPIHDITTNLADMPEFGRLRVREDNYKSVEKTSRAELQPLPPVERWRRLHAEAYGDLRTVRVPWSVAETVQRAERVARDKGWDIARVDPGAGVLEATATTFFFRFKDDVVLRARAAPGRNGTDVDMRSLSRVGGSDVGKNAERIREFLADLQRG